MTAWDQHGWLAMRATTRPDACALVFADSGERWTFRDLAGRAWAVASALSDAGAVEGTRVLVPVTSARDAAVILHGVWMAGACAIPVHPRWTDAEVTHAVRTARPELAVGARAAGYGGAVIPMPTEPVVPPTVPTAPDAFELDGQWIAALEAEAGARSSPAMIVMTSGTTGAPRAAVLSRRALLASSAASALRLGVERGDRWLACMPLSHVGGAMILARSVCYGTAVIAVDGYTPESMHAAAERFGATLVSLVPTMLARQLASAWAEAPATIRATLVGGAAASPTLLASAHAHGWHPRATYGLSEACSQVCTVAAGDRADAGDVGEPLVGTRIRIDEPDEHGVGGVEVRGPTVMDGYLGDAAATATALRDGWLRTGDLGRIEAGRLTLVARRTDLIVSGGENVYPAEVEAAIDALAPGIESVVLGVEDAHWGQRVVALVHDDRDAGRAMLASVEALRDALRGTLAAFKLPRELAVTPAALPRTSTGKLDRGGARRLLASGTNGEIERTMPDGAADAEPLQRSQDVSESKPIRRIVVGVSFQENPFEPEAEVTPEERHLIDTAIGFAASHGAGLVFLSALEHGDAPLPNHDTTVHDVLRRRIRPVHDALIAEAAQRGVRAAGRISEGRGWELLSDEVSNNGADLVMVNQRRSAKPVLDRILLGSTAARLIRHCPGNVWIVHPLGHASQRCVLVPVDFSDVSARQIAVAAQLAGESGGEIHVVHSMSYPNDIALHRLADAESAIEAYHSDVRAAASARMDALLGDTPVAGRHLVDEWIVAAAPRLVAELGADMVVMGSVGRAGVQGLIVGNTAEKLFRMLDVSTWVVKPEGWKP